MQVRLVQGALFYIWQDGFSSESISEPFSQLSALNAPTIGVGTCVKLIYTHGCTASASFIAIVHVLSHLIELQDNVLCDLSLAVFAHSKLIGQVKANSYLHATATVWGTNDEAAMYYSRAYIVCIVGIFLQDLIFA